LKRVCGFLIIFFILLLTSCRVDLQDMDLKGKIVFRGPGSKIWLMDLETGKCRKIPLRIRSSDFALSPDGKRITYTYRGLWIADLDGKNKEKLTSSCIHSPNWSPDGKKIVFYKAGTWAPDLKKVIYCKKEERGTYVIDIDNKNETLLIKGAWSPSWSPDGKRIAFTEYNSGSQICLTNVDGTDKIYLTSIPYKYNGHPDWSPDGKKIIFDDRENVYIMNKDGSNQICLTNLKKPHIASLPQWSPDGRKIFYWMGMRDSPARSLYIMNPDGGNKRRLLRFSTLRILWGDFWGI